MYRDLLSIHLAVLDQSFLKVISRGHSGSAKLKGISAACFSAVGIVPFWLWLSTVLTFDCKCSWAMDLSKKKASALPTQHLTIPQHLALFLSCSSVWYVARNQIEQFKPPDFAELEERSMTSEPPFPSCELTVILSRMRSKVLLHLWKYSRFCCSHWKLLWMSAKLLWNNSWELIFGDYAKGWFWEALGGLLCKGAFLCMCVFGFFFFLSFFSF